MRWRSPFISLAGRLAARMNTFADIVEGFDKRDSISHVITSALVPV